LNENCKREKKWSKRITVNKWKLIESKPNKGTSRKIKYNTWSRGSN